MQHRFLALLLCVALFAVVEGYYSQIRLMNARLHYGLNVSVTDYEYRRNNLSMNVLGQYGAAIPASNYIDIPDGTGLFRVEGTPPIYYVYNADYGDYPLEILTALYASPTLLDSQRYTMVYVGPSDELNQDVPAQLFFFTDVGPHYGPILKIVNVIVASFNSSIRIYSDRYDFTIPYGADTDFIELSTTGYENFTVVTPGFTETFTAFLGDESTVIYLRGDVGYGLGYDIVRSNFYQFHPTPTSSEEPVSQPIAATPTASEPTVYPRIRYIAGKAYDNGEYYTLVMSYNGGFPKYNFTTASVSQPQYLYSGEGYYILEVYDGTGNMISRLGYTIPNDAVWFVFSDYIGNFYFYKEYPETFNNNDKYARVWNFVQSSGNIRLYNWALNFTQGFNFISLVDYFTNPADYVYFDANFYGTNATLWGSFYTFSGYATTVFMVGNPSNPFFYVDYQLLPEVQPVCMNGAVESNGECNCYSGYASYGNPQYKCNYGSPYYCYQSQNDSLSNDVVPYIAYWNTQVYGDQLQFSIFSAMVSNRRTLIEMPNPQCSYINSPQYYQKNLNGCEDQFDVNIPYLECGFIKASTSSEDTYKGTVHVKQIDRVTVGGTTYDRVIDTPMPIVIRMPKALAVQSYIQVFGPPSLAIDAAFVGQTVSTESQSGNLQYISAVQYPLAIETVQLVDLPDGVNAWIEVINVNCSSVGPCVQRLEIHLNTTSCSISGTYRMVVSLSCRSAQGCPDEALNGTQVYIESRIVSQSLCGEVSVDIDLSGYIQAYTDQSFSTPSLAFYPGQSAYFLISAYSSRVSLSIVSVESVYYYGPNVGFQYLSYNNTRTDIAVANNFMTGSVGSNQAWFGLDVSVSTPNSANNTSLFQLYQGQNSVYNFVAIVDVEWYVANTTPQSSSTPAPVVTPIATPLRPPIVPPVPVATPTASPVAPPTPLPVQPVTPSLKKRMVLQGSVSNQGSQFTAQVQVAGPMPAVQQPTLQHENGPAAVAKPTPSPVSSGVVTSMSLFVLTLVLVAILN